METKEIDGLEITMDAVCPICKYPKVVKLSTGPDAWLAWCPCGTKFDEERILNTMTGPTIKEWWKK